MSGNHLEDISALGQLPQLLTIHADNNKLTSVKLSEVGHSLTTDLLASCV